MGRLSNLEDDMKKVVLVLDAIFNCMPQSIGDVKLKRLKELKAKFCEPKTLTTEEIEKKHVKVGG